jgi:hypothetical protein
MRACEHIFVVVSVYERLDSGAQRVGLRVRKYVLCPSPHILLTSLLPVCSPVPVSASVKSLHCHHIAVSLFHPFSSVSAEPILLFRTCRNLALTIYNTSVTAQKDSVKLDLMVFIYE